MDYSLHPSFFLDCGRWARGVQAHDLQWRPRSSSSRSMQCQLRIQISFYLVSLKSHIHKIFHHQS
jgi:hypothetical protein